MSKWVLYIGLLCMIYASFIYYPKWKMSRTEATISWDVSGYYLYLPAIFIYHDIKQLKWKKAIDDRYFPSSSPYQSYTHQGGNQVMKYTLGLAILYSPFFLMAHTLAPLFGFEADGYSKIYQFFISFGSLIWAAIGLWFLRKLLLRYFGDHAVSLVLISLVLASNYFDYASITGAMSHNYLFTLYAVLLYSIDNYYLYKKNIWFYISCMTIGMMVLIRPTEIISCLLLIGWKTDTLEALKARILFFIGTYRLLILGGISFLLLPLMQSIYWKYVTGEWIVYSYQDQGFSWLEGHHILQGLFSYRAGWIVYTPVMILVLIGMIYAVWKSIQNSWLYLLFILLSLYLTFAWDEWTYGGSLSQRALVQHYPVMSFPIIILVGNLITFQKFKYILFVFLGGCIYYNLWLTHQAHRGGIYEAGMMNKAYFWQTLFKNENNQEYKKLLDTNEPVLLFNDTDAEKIVDKFFNPDSTCAQNAGFSLLYDGSIPAGKIKVEVLFKAGLKEWDVWQMAQLVVKYKQDLTDVKTTIIRVHRFLNDNDEKWIDLVTTSPSKPFSKLEITIWNPGNKSICAKALKLYAEK